MFEPICACNAKDFHEQFVQAALDSEEQTQQRNNVWNPVVDHLHRIGDFLKKLYTDNDKGLGQYGYTVDASPRPPKLQKSKVLPADKITVTSIVIGGTFTNTGTVDLHVYKGKTTTGNPVIVHPNEKLGTTKGFSTITVSNPDSTTKGIFTALRNK